MPSEENDKDLQAQPADEAPEEQPGAPAEEEARTVVMPKSRSRSGSKAKEPAGPAEEEQPRTVAMSGAEAGQAAGEAKETPGEDAWKTARVPQTAPPPPAPKAAPAEDAGWQTAGTPAAPAAPAAKPKAAQPAQAEAAGPTPVAREVPPAESLPAAEAPAGGGFWEKLGITDKKTQQWVLIGGGIVIGLCCICSCAALVIYLITSS